MVLKTDFWTPFPTDVNRKKAIVCVLFLGLFSLILSQNLVEIEVAKPAFLDSKRMKEFEEVNYMEITCNNRDVY